MTSYIPCPMFSFNNLLQEDTFLPAALPSPPRYTSLAYNTPSSPLPTTPLHNAAAPTPPSTLPSPTTQTPPLPQSAHLAVLHALRAASEWGKLVHYVENTLFPEQERELVFTLWEEALCEQEKQRLAVPTLQRIQLFRLRKRSRDMREVLRPQGAPLVNGRMTLTSRARLEAVFAVAKNPSTAENRRLMQSTGLALTQINNFFKNKRRGKYL